MSQTDIIISYRSSDKMYLVNDRRVDSDTSTVAYYVRHMCGVPHLKRPAHLYIRELCYEARDTHSPVRVIIR